MLKIETATTSAALLVRHAVGDPEAPQELVVRNLDWLGEQADRRLGAALRGKAETGDIVQDALVSFLRCGPKVISSSPRHSSSGSSSMSSSIRSAITTGTSPPNVEIWRGRHRAPRTPSFRSTRRGRGAHPISSSPSSCSNRRIGRSWSGELGIKRVSKRIATAVASTPDAVRMRLRRALARLAGRLVRLRHGEI